MEVEPTFLPPFPTRHSVSMIIADSDSSPLTPWKWVQHQTLALATRCDIGSLSSGFLTWPGPRVPGRHCGTGKRIRRHWVLRHRSPSPLTRYPHQTLPRLHPAQSRLVLLRATVLLIISPFAQSPAGLPLTPRHQSGRPQAPDALPPSLISRSGMFRGRQGKHQSLTAFASSLNSAGSYRQWPGAIVAMTSTDGLRSDPNPVN